MSSKFLKSLSILFLVVLGTCSICFAGTDAMPMVTTEREQRPIFIVLVRHLRTQDNMKMKTHSADGAQLDAESSGKGMSLLSDFAVRYSDNIQGLYCGTDIRHYSTLSTVALKTGKEVQKMQNFDEFNLGILRGLSETEVQKRPEFANIFVHPDREVPDGDSINSVKNKFLEGLGHVVRNAMRDENSGINMICTSRITMNIALRYLLQNDKFLNPKIPNCGAYIFKYIPYGDELDSHQIHRERFELLNCRVEILNGDTVIPGVEALGKSVGTPLRDHDEILQEFAKQHSITGLTSVTPAPHTAQPDEISPTSEVKDEEKEIVVARTEDDSDSEVTSDPEDFDSEGESSEQQVVDNIVLPVAQLPVKRTQLVAISEEGQAANTPSLELRKNMVALRLGSPFKSLNGGLSFKKPKNLRTCLSRSQGDLPVVVSVDPNVVWRCPKYCPRMGVDCLSPVNFTPPL